MKAVQPGGPETLIHRCIVAYGLVISGLLIVSSGFADEGRAIDDYAQVYVNQFFEPDEDLVLSEAAKRKSLALAHYAQGRSFESQGKPGEAVEAYTKVLENQPDQFFLARKTAYLLARSGQQEEALKLLEESLKLNPNQPYAHISLSEFLATYQSNDPQGKHRAFSVIEEAVDKFPDEPAVYEHLVKLYLSSDRRDDARKTVAEAAQRSNDDSVYWLRLGRLAARVWPPREGGEVSDADLVNGIFAKALQFAKGDVAVIEQVGDYYHATGQFDRAIAAYAGIISTQPDRLDLREKLARVYGAKGDEEKVIETLKEIVEIDPQNATIHKQIAGIYMQSERFKEAIPFLQTALSITKGTATEYGALGRMMIESDENEVAVEFLKDAAYLFPESPDFPFLLTFSLAKTENWDEAIKQFKATIELARDAQPQLLNEGFYFRYAAAHEQSGNLKEAEELFRKTIELIAKNEPDEESQKFSATVYNYLGYMWLENDMKIEEAGELIKAAVDLDPESGAIADSLGWFHFKKGNYEAARDELLRAEGLIEEIDPVILDHIGQTYYQLGEKDRAIEYLEKAVALEPDNEEYTTRLKEFRDGTAKLLKPQSTNTPPAAGENKESAPSKLPSVQGEPSAKPAAVTNEAPR